MIKIFGRNIGQAGLGQFIPLGAVEQLVGLAAAEAIRGDVLQGQLIHDLVDLLLLRLHSGIVAASLGKAKLH